MTVGVDLPAKLVPVFEGEADYRGAFGGRGSSKCLGKGTKLLRADASIVDVEDVRQGDLLLGPDGKPRTVLSLARGVGPLYQITQKTGMSYVVNDIHILVMERSKSACEDYGNFSDAGNPQRRNGRYAGYVHPAGYSFITAAEYASKPERFKAQHYGIRRAIVGVHKALPVDPYLLGLWLGDGSSKAPEITNVDPEIIEFLRGVSVENGWSFSVFSTLNRVNRYYMGSKFQRAGSFVQQLRSAGVFKNKHIPEAYFGASIEQRRSLLAGLVDTDGCVSTGCVGIAQSREALLDDIVRLAHGLGLKASKVHRVIPCNGRDCDAWYANLGGDIDKLPLRIERKRLGAIVRKNKDWRRTRVDIEPIGLGEFYGFELDGDHLFMLADGTVTHNTRSFAKMAAVVGVKASQSGRTGVIVCAREFMNSLADSSFAEVKGAIESEPWLAQFYEIGTEYIRTKDRRVNFVFCGMRHNIASIKSKAKILLLWVDEAEPVTDTAWTTADNTVREEGAETWITWNPEIKTSATNKRFRENPPPRSKIVELNWRDNPWFPDLLNRKRLNCLQNDPDQYDHIWDGGYKTVVDGAYYTKHLMAAKEQGRICRLAMDPLMAVRLFCDIGGTGAKSDAFTIWATQFIGREIHYLNYYEAVGQDLAAHLGWCRSQGYGPGQAEFILPHDGATHDKVFNVSYESALKQAGYGVTTIPNQGPGAAMMRVEAARRLFPRMWFDEVKTEAGRDALAWYHEKKDEKRNIGLGPCHDWASNGADSHGLSAVAYKEPKTTAAPVVPGFSNPIPGMGMLG